MGIETKLEDKAKEIDSPKTGDKSYITPEDMLSSSRIKSEDNKIKIKNNYSHYKHHKHWTRYDHY